MKKLFVVVICLTLNFTCVSQEDSLKKINLKNHEIKLDAFQILDNSVYLTYENFTFKKFSLGTSLVSNLKKHDFKIEQFSISPFVRYYLDKNNVYKANGFFFEAFYKYLEGVDTFFIQPEDVLAPRIETISSFSANVIGASFGKKWVTESNISIELVAGLGRNLKDIPLEPLFFPKFNFNIGYRF
ncbi:hypothetical protein [uncultured Flavobacterium sp.]|uniref:hypothetical protein n=1 Tax=uncultured Flavobacterium sp. TaxID=165435 RepID=UPI0030ED631E|tara:strand:+ start:1367 stop:1921 length:555 start_codon:yes stop_codon:yes gene_type:complete